MNEARTKAGKQPLPFLNPMIYPIMSSGSFRDITTGNSGAYSAGIGHDLVTGIGVPDLKALTDELKSKWSQRQRGPSRGRASCRVSVADFLLHKIMHRIEALSARQAAAGFAVPEGLNQDPRPGRVARRAGRDKGWLLYECCTR